MRVVDLNNVAVASPFWLCAISVALVLRRCLKLASAAMLHGTSQSFKQVALFILFSLTLSSAPSAADVIQTSGGHFDLEYRDGARQITLRLKDRQPLLRGVTAAAVFPAGEATISDDRYIRRHQCATSPEPLLPAEQLVVFCTDQQRQLDLEYRITLLPGRAGPVFELKLTNAPAQELLVRHAEPLRALLRPHAVVDRLQVDL